MATRSTISIVDKKTKTGKGRQIYCHWDGYKENNGAILLQHYNNAEKINELIDLGSISSLRPNIKPSKIGTLRTWNGNEYVETETSMPHTFDSPHENVVIAYMRDRGETEQEAKHFVGGKPNKEYSEEYDYLFVVEEGQWYVRENYGNKPRFVKLTKKMCGI